MIIKQKSAYRTANQREACSLCVLSCMSESQDKAMNLTYICFQIFVSAYRKRNIPPSSDDEISEAVDADYCKILHRTMVQ
jgi:hypothetical protein